MVVINTCDLTSAQLSSFMQEITIAGKKIVFFPVFLSSLQESNIAEGDQTDWQQTNAFPLTPLLST